MTRNLYERVVEAAVGYGEALGRRPVGVARSNEALEGAIDARLPEAGEPPEAALEALLTATDGGLVGSTGGRYFGFVVGGAPAVSVASDWLTSAWDQNAQVYSTSPAAALIEDVVRGWLLDLLSLPPDAGVGFVTGAQMASFVGLSVARNEVLAQHAWDVDRDGLQGAPRLHVVVGECGHGTVLSAIRMMGLGTRNILVVPADEQGRMRTTALEEVLESCVGPTIVCSQAGNVNTGAFDPLEPIAALTHDHGGWLHVDGAFGLWARAHPGLRQLSAGAELADSWATDAHKWPGVPYDSGLAIVRSAAAHRGLKKQRCAYAGAEETGRRDGFAWVPENSRRARGFVLYATLRHLGRQGVAHLVETCCAHARALACGLGELPGARIVNDVVLNQVLCRLEPEGVSDLDAFNGAVAERVQQAGECWLGTTVWRGQTMLRLSVANLSTTAEDVERSLASVRACVEAERVGLARTGGAGRVRGRV